MADLGQAIGAAWRGEAGITAVAPLDEAGSGILTFAKGPVPPNGALVIGGSLPADNPRLAFARALGWLESTIGFIRDDAEPVLGEGAMVGRHSVLGRGVVVGPGTRIGHNVTIADGVRIGADCRIASGAVIGEGGFGYERDETGRPIPFPQLGSVVLGDRVAVGSRAVVCRGTLVDTIVGNDVKIDDGAQIAHNCRIARNSLIHAHAVLSGGVAVGQGCWIGPGATLIQHITIGDGAVIGIGANVIRDLPANTTVAGNPARPLASC